MTLPTIDQARSWRGLTLVATDDEPVGKIEAIYVDRSTRKPEWALVNTGLFGSSRTFVPLADAAQRGDTVRVPHETSVVREAPRLEQDAELSEEDEARLYAHYGIQYATDASSSGLPAGETTTAGAGAAATDATTELPPSTRLEAGMPAAGMIPGTGQTATRRRPAPPGPKRRPAGTRAARAGRRPPPAGCPPPGARGPLARPRARRSRPASRRRPGAGSGSPMPASGQGPPDGDGGRISGAGPRGWSCFPRPRCSGRPAPGSWTRRPRSR
jgi:PRC-barrel domain